MSVVISVKGFIAQVITFQNTVGIEHHAVEHLILTIIVFMCIDMDSLVDLAAWLEM